MEPTKLLPLVSARKVGRPPGRATNTRTKQLTIRLRVDEFEKIKAAADRTGENAAMWGRRLLLRLAGDDAKTKQLSFSTEFKRLAGNR